MPSTPESPDRIEYRLDLSGQQRTLHEVIIHKNEALAHMYLGALYVFEQKLNPDYLPLAAHGIRELIEKLPKLVGVTSQRPDISAKCEKLSKKWERHAMKSGCYSDNAFSGNVDKKLEHFLICAKDFFEWFRNRPNRRDERKIIIKAFDMTNLEMPGSIVKIRTDEFAGYAKYFTNVSHHSRSTTEDEFSAHLDQLERFILDFLCPRTFEDHSAIDALIQAGENDAE